MQPFYMLYGVTVVPFTGAVGVTPVGIAVGAHGSMVGALLGA